MLAILDYKAGNQTSVRRALEHLGIPCVITADPAVVEAAQGVIFPGVGAAGQAMGQLAQSAPGGQSMAETLAQSVRRGQPLLGICLGCQILLERSDENDTRTLGIISGQCRRFDASWAEEDGTPIRIPHMGWNGLHTRKETALLRHVPEDAEFYFVHSYYVEPQPDLVLATTVYGREFCAIYGRDGLWAVQFHLEKSGRPGLQLLSNFYAYCGEATHA